MTLERGAFLYNRYRILEILGQGGMGSIYRGIDENLGVEVAVKENLFTTDEYARQFRREAVILANLRHPNLPRVSDHFVIDGQGQYLVMDYIEGEDLRERMDRLGVIPEEDILVIGGAICDALSYMHSRKPPVLHRDIKPGNVKITPQGEIFLVDFGLAKVVQPGEQTSTGARAMTPGYSPPEQYGAARTDHRSDIYSLGATMYAALVGVIPEDSLARTMEQTELTPLRKRNSKITRRTASAIEKALEVHPDERFQDAAEFKQALISARSATLRRMVDDGVIEPASNDRFSDFAMTDIASEPLASQPANRPVTATPGPSLPISTPIAENIEYDPPSKKKKRGRGCLWVLLIISGLLIGLAGGAYLVNPQIPLRLYQIGLEQVGPLAGLPVSASSPTPVSVAFTDTPAPAAPSTDADTATPEPPTPTASPTAMLEQTATPSEIPTQTNTPSITPTPEPSLSPTITPKGGGFGQIAYVSDVTGIPQIWLMNADGSDQHQLTDIPWGACQPNWSPDGAHFLFVSPCEDNREAYRGSNLYIANADGTNVEQITTTAGGDYDPSWSPDGQQILFTSLRDGNWPKIYLMDFETREVTTLSAAEFRDLQPIWFPDGSHIIFVSTVNGPYQIWTMTLDTREAKRFSASRDLKDTDVTISPDGNVLIFTQSTGPGSLPKLRGAYYPDGAEREFDVYPFHGSIPMREAEFSPDGYWLVLESWPDGIQHDIYLMSPTGAELTQLTNDDALNFDATWRPINP